MKCLYVRVLPRYELNRLVRGDVAARAEAEWVRVEEKEGPRFIRVIAGYAVTVEPWLSRSLELVDEVLQALEGVGDALEAVVEAWRLVDSYEHPELLVCDNGVVRTPYGGPFTWFHGQEAVNHLLRQLRLRLTRDYDGVTTVEVEVERPYTAERLSQALSLLAMGVRLYALIERVQEAEAVKLALAYLAGTLAKR